MADGEMSSIDLVARLARCRNDITVGLTLAGEDCWRSRFAVLTRDIPSAPSSLPLTDLSCFLLCLIESRGIAAVLKLQRLLPHIGYCSTRFRQPDVTLVDVHMETDHWRSGGMGRVSVAHHELLDRG
jgi:hypothetical protein